MEDRELYKAIENLARQVKKSGQAKSRRSHLFVAQMLYIIMGAMAIDSEEGLLGAMQAGYTKLFDAWNEQIKENL